MPSFSFLQFVFENFVSIKNVICIAHPLKVAFLDWYTFLIKALSPLLNGNDYQYAVIALTSNLSKAHETRESLQQFLFADNRSLVDTGW